MLALPPRYVLPLAAQQQRSAFVMLPEQKRGVIYKRSICGYVCVQTAALCVKL